jgi:ATP diphosphatase
MSRHSLQDLLTLMDCLRDPYTGCPWDLNQDFASIAPHTLEEVYEVIDAIERGDHSQLPDELGDLMFQVVFYARLGKEAGLFDFDTIVDAITRKLLRRHPHVFPAATLVSFGRGPTGSAEAVTANWEAIKAEERSGKKAGFSSALDDVPQALPAMLRAAKLQKRAANRGFDWQHADGVLDKLAEEIAELQQARRSGDAAAVQDELGDVMFTMVNLARHLKVEPEQALRQANRKFEQRFRLLEQRIAADGLTMENLDADQLEQYWKQVKEAAHRSA